MLRKGLRKLINWAARGDNEVSMKPHHADQLLSGLPIAMIVCPISNGYMLRVESRTDNFRDGNYNNSTIIYAKDEKDVADQIVAHQARVTMGVDKPIQGEMYTSNQMGAQLASTNAQTRSK